MAGDEHKPKNPSRHHPAPKDAILALELSCRGLDSAALCHYLELGITEGLIKKIKMVITMVGLELCLFLMCICAILTFFNHILKISLLGVDEGSLYL